MRRRDHSESEVAVAPATPLPTGWSAIRLTDAADVRLGRQRSPGNHNGPNMRPYLRAANVTWDGLDLSDVNEMNFPPEQLETFRLQPEDILLSEASGSASEVGKPAIWRGEIENCCFQNTLIRVRSCGPDPRYLLLHFKADAELGRFSKAARGVGIHHLGAKAMEEWTIRLAPFGEQGRIVDEAEKQFTRLDAAVAGLQRVKANLKRYRASVLKAACEGRLVPTEAELARREGRPFESGEELLKRILKERRAQWEADQLEKIKAAGKVSASDGWRAGYREPRKPENDGMPLPEGWVSSTVETVGDVLLGRQRAPQYQTGRWTRPYLRVANVKDDRLDFRDVETMDFDPVHFQKYQLSPGDILISEGQSPERVGESAIYRGGIVGLCFQKTLHRFRPVRSGPSSEFAQIVFRTHVKTGVFMRLASITTNIAHLTLEKFEAAPFPLPPLPEQRRIVAEVERRLSVVDELEATVEKNLVRCARLRQSILKMAFEGRLVPQDPHDEQASVLLEQIRKEREANDARPKHAKGKK